MMSKKLTVLAAVLLSLLMLMSAWTVSVFAEETTAGEQSTTVAEPGDTAEPAESGTTAEADTSAETGKETGTTSETTAATTTGAATTEDNSAKKESLTRGLINLGVGLVILIVLVILCIKFRDKIPGWWKALKSECGKISWCSKDKLKKNTFVVVVIILVLAIVIGVLDFVFSKGWIMLRDLLQGI